MFEPGDSVKIDGEVPGVVDGKYNNELDGELIVVRLGLHHGVRGVFNHSGEKEAFVSLLLVHPGNLKPA